MCLKNILLVGSNRAPLPVPSSFCMNSTCTIGILIQWSFVVCFWGACYVNSGVVWSSKDIFFDNHGWGIKFSNMQGTVGLVAFKILNENVRRLSVTPVTHHCLHILSDVHVHHTNNMVIGGSCSARTDLIQRRSFCSLIYFSWTAWSFKLCIKFRPTKTHMRKETKVGGKSESTYLKHLPSIKCR